MQLGHVLHRLGTRRSGERKEAQLVLVRDRVPDGEREVWYRMQGHGVDGCL